MAIILNLLPPEYSVKKGFSAIAKIVKNLTVILLVVFLVFIVGVSGFFLISSQNLKQLTANVELLKNQVKAQETTEQRLVLLKDRLSKIKDVQAQESSKEELVQIDSILGDVADGSVGELKVDPKKIGTSLIFSSSQGLTNFINSLSLSDIFNSIVMTSFGFNPSTGYLTGLRFANK